MTELLAFFAGTAFGFIVALFVLLLMQASK